jgi:hypothetical protein
VELFYPRRKNNGKKLLILKESDILAIIKKDRQKATFIQDRSTPGFEAWR